MPTINEKASNGVLDRFPTRIVDVIDFHDCAQGLGLKIFGGVSSRGDEHGIFVKQVVPGGLAALAERLQPGDELLEVNGRALEGLTNSKAVSLLRACAAQRILTLVISRDTEAYKGYHRLCSSILSGSIQSLNVSDDIPRYKYKGNLSDKQAYQKNYDESLHIKHVEELYNHRPSPSHNTFSSDESSSPLNTYRNKRTTADRNTERYSRTRELIPSITTDSASEGQISPIPQLPPSAIRTVFIEYKTGLGMSICGGTNKAEGPGIYIDSVIKGGDVQRQGIMQPGDELISVNGHVLQGLTHERAMKILTRLKLRQVKQVEIHYKAGDGVSPRQKIRQNKEQSDLNTNGILKKSPSTTSANKTYLSTSTLDRASARTPTKNLEMRTTGVDSNRLGGTSSTRSITDTASNFLNAKLDESSTPLRTGSLSPAQQISMDKLVVALKYLGYNPTAQQLHELKQKLVIDSDNKVRYAEFVTAAREVFAYKLKEGVSPNDLRKTGGGVKKSESMEDISRSRVELNKSLNTLNDYSKQKSGGKRRDLSSSVPDLSVPHSIPHRNELRSASSLANPVNSILGHVSSSRNRSMNSSNSPRSEEIHSSVSAFSTSGWSLPQYDKDYSSCDPAELIRECAILAAELRKSEKVILQYKAITEKLVNFASNVQRSFKAEVSRSRSLERGTPLDRSRTRQSLATVIHGSNKTISEAQEMLHDDMLPQGWEEAFTEDGARYYINHFTQTTSWDRPVG